MEAWAAKTFVGDNSWASAHANGHAIGMCEAYQKVLDVTVHELNGDDDGE